MAEAWSQRQMEVVRAIADDSLDVVTIAGPVQAGKTRAAVFGLLRWLTLHHQGEDVILCTRTARQMQGSILKMAAEFARLIGASWRRRGEGWEIGSQGGAPNRLYPVYASDESAESRARSYSAIGALVDEATLLPQSVVTTIADRCSRPGARLVISTNPAGPHHWVKTTYIDDAPDTHRHIKFSLADNPTLTRRYVAGLQTRYTGAWRARMVEGEWVSAEGSVFPLVLEAVGRRPPAGAMWRWTAGADWAHSSVTHVVLIGHHVDGTRWAWAEWRHDGAEQGRLTETQQAQRIRRWIGDRELSGIWVDPSAPALIAALRREGMRARRADNDVLAGIQYVAQETESGAVRIASHCRELVAELSDYRWDPDAAAAGIDKPLKERDHGPDALRYALWSESLGRARAPLRIVRAA